MKQTNNQQHANHRAQGIIRKFIVLVILVLTCTNCQVDEQVLKSNEAHNGADKGEISFKQFATETGTLHFKTALAIHNNKNIYSKSINELSEFYIDTIAIRKLISKNQKATYTFRIYPLFKKNEPNEFYNLVYHKVNDSWTTSVFLLKKNLNPNIKNRPFETIEKITSQLKVPNKTQKTAAECFQFYTEIRCDGSCPDACDGLKCPQGVCYYIGIAQVSCGGGFQTSTTPINYPNTDNNNTGGGSNTDFVFTPNTLKNLDINDANYINLWNTVNVWTSLDGPEILFFRNDAQNMIFFDATIQYQIDNKWSSESAVIANSLRKAKFENPEITFNDVYYNRTSLDANSAVDINNNTDGGNDTNSYADFNPQQTWTTISQVIPTNNFVGWGSPGIKRNCMDYAKAQIAKNGYQISNYGSAGQTFQIYTEQNGVNQANLTKSLSYLKYALSNNIPVIVGVDDNPGHPGNPDNSTDHFVVIVGMGSNSNGNYFQFYDNASGNISQGTSPLNLLYYNSSTGKISGKSQCSGYFNSVAHDYIITQIRKSKTKL